MNGHGVKLIARKVLHRGKIFSAIVDEVEYPSGRTTVREIAEHPGGAVALAMFDDETILLVRQHRYPLDDFLWELPAGKLDPMEDPLVCARRELQEETGYVAKSWTPLLTICTSPGFCSEILHLFLATGLELHAGGTQREEGEQSMTMKSLPFTEALAMISRGEIRDAKTICGILAYSQFRR